MTIIEKVKQSVEVATGMPFVYHAAGEINEIISRLPSLPVAYSFLLDSGSIEESNGNYYEQVTLAVMFCDKTEFDFNAIENEQIIDRMKVKAYKWLQSLRDNSNALRIVSVNSTQRLYDNTTAILTGYAVNITLQDTSGEGDCTLPDVVIPIESNGEYNVVGVDKVDVNVTPILQDLSITANGTYLPDEGYAGFSQVVAEFDTSSLPKVKISFFNVTNSCINEDGVWEGESVINIITCISSLYGTFRSVTKVTHLNLTKLDVSNVTSLRECFQSCSSLVELNVSNWNTSKVTSLWYTFYGINLTTLNVANWDTSNVKEFVSCFRKCIRLIQLDLTNWNAISATNVMEMFDGCNSLTSLVGGRSINDVIVNNIRVLGGLKISAPGNTFAPASKLDRASLRAVINGLADLTGQTARTLTLGATLMAKLTEEDIAIATNKNWTIA